MTSYLVGINGLPCERGLRDTLGARYQGWGGGVHLGGCAAKSLKFYMGEKAVGKDSAKIEKLR
jgi:hypothetical protein